MRRSRRRSRRQKRQFVGDIVCLETFKVSEAHRAMWYTSGTLEPNPADHICDCVMSCTPGTCQRGRLATNRFFLKKRCGPFHPPVTSFATYVRRRRILNCQTYVNGTHTFWVQGVHTQRNQLNSSGKSLPPPDVTNICISFSSLQQAMQAHELCHGHHPVQLFSNRAILMHSACSQDLILLVKLIARLPKRWVDEDWGFSSKKYHSTNYQYFTIEQSVNTGQFVILRSSALDSEYVCYRKS